MKPLRILITNDDGFEAIGLKVLRETLREYGQVYVVAPTTEKSACAHSITLTKPLRFIKIDDDFYKLDDGTPSDCIYLANHALFGDEIKPDIIFSGVNKGGNMGEDITYSGTAAGAMEGALQGIPSVAISQVCNGRCEGIEMYDFELARYTIRYIMGKFIEGGLPLGHRRFLNINIPPIPLKEFKGFKITNAGYRHYGNDAHLHRNPRGEEYYWLGLHPLDWTPQSDGNSDFDAVKDGYVSITPVKLNMTDFEEIERLKQWI